MFQNTTPTGVNILADDADDISLQLSKLLGKEYCLHTLQYHYVQCITQRYWLKLY